MASGIYTDLETMYLFPDVELICKDGNLPCHRMVLAKNSYYFMTLFKNILFNGNSVEINDYTKEEVSIILMLVYERTITDYKINEKSNIREKVHENIYALIHFCDEYQIVDEIKGKIDSFIELEYFDDKYIPYELACEAVKYEYEGIKYHYYRCLFENNKIDIERELRNIHTLEDVNILNIMAVEIKDYLVNVLNWSEENENDSLGHKFIKAIEDCGLFKKQLREDLIKDIKKNMGESRIKSKPNYSNDYL